MPPLGLDGPESASTPVRIALITFAFDNARVINWLRERGEYIKVEDWQGLDRVNNQIRDALKNDSSLLDDLKRPVSAFITFETEEGHARGIMYDEVAEANEKFAYCRKFLGQDISIQGASEPTDIIWENRGYTPEERMGKRGIVGLIIFVLLAISFVVIFYF